MRTAWFCAIVLAGAVVLACQYSAPTPTRPTVAGPKPVPTTTTRPLPGRLLYARGNRLIALTIATGEKATVAELPAGAIVGPPAATRAGDRVAFTVYVPPSDPKVLGGADLYGLELSGGAPRPLAVHEAPGVSFDAPAWSADGRAVYATRRAAVYEGAAFKGEEVGLERVEVDGSGRRAIARDAANPALSPDGRLLAFTRGAEGVPAATVWTSGVDGSAPREVAGAGFSQVGMPRFAPDGATLLFGGVDGPTATPSRASIGGGGVLGRLVGVALAHGTPWDFWRVGTDGAGLRRLTDVGEDAPAPAWSSDGTWVAFAGEMGIYLHEIAAARTVLIPGEIAVGLAWLPT